MLCVLTRAGAVAGAGDVAVDDVAAVVGPVCLVVMKPENCAQYKLQYQWYAVDLWHSKKYKSKIELTQLVINENNTYHENTRSKNDAHFDIVDDAVDDVVDDDASAALSAPVSAIASAGAPSIVAVVSSQSDVYRKVGNGDGIAAFGGRKRQRSDSAEHDRCDYHHNSYGRNFCSRSSSSRRRFHTDLPLEWWDRAEDCKEAKARHTARIDHICESREQLVLKTTLWKEDTVLEPNMFPCKTLE